MKNILYISGTSEIGGADIVLLDLIKKIDKKEFAPFVILPKHGPFVNDFIAAGAIVIFQRVSTIFRMRRVIEFINYFTYFIPNIIKITNIIRKNRIKLVHSNSSVVFSGAFAARLCRIPHLWHVREIFFKAGWISKAVLKVVSTFSDKIICISDAVKNTFPEKISKKEYIKVIYDGVDENIFSPENTKKTLRTKYKIGSNALIFGMACRMVPVKGHEMFIKAALPVVKEYPDTKFIIAGDIVRDDFIDYKNKLLLLVKELNIEDNVLFLGNQKGMQHIINDFDVMVLPTISPEPSGRVILEAMSLEKPVIATNFGGPCELVVPNKTGLLFPPEYKELAKAMLFLIKNPELRKKMGREGRRCVIDRFSLRKHCLTVQNVYKELLKNLN